MLYPIKGIERNKVYLDNLDDPNALVSHKGN